MVNVNPWVREVLIVVIAAAAANVVNKKDRAGYTWHVYAVAALLIAMFFVGVFSDV